MKRFFPILLSVLYLLTSVGVGINFHYCLGKLAYVEIMGPVDHCCCGDAEEVAHCCEDETYFFQLETEQQTSQSLRLIDPMATDWVSDKVLTDDTRTDKICPSPPDSPPPPRPPLWLLNCSLTYFG